MTAPQTTAAQAPGPVLRTPRLVLRPLSRADAPRIAVLAGDWGVASMTARIPYPYSEESACHWIDGLADGEAVFGITLGGDLIGLCGYRPSGGGSAEIGYWIGRSWWGHGYATEAAGAVIAHCFAEKSLERLVCCHFIGNPASARVIAKLGFRPVDRVVIWCDARNADVEALRHELLKQEFLKPAESSPQDSGRVPSGPRGD